MMTSYQIVRYVLYHSVLYKLYNCFAASTMPYFKRSLYMMAIVLLFSSILHFAHSMLRLHPSAEFNQDMFSAINTFSIVLVLLITITLVIPWLRRLSRLMIVQAKDNEKAAKKNESKLRVIATDQHMMELEFMYTVTRITNVV